MISANNFPYQKLGKKIKKWWEKLSKSYILKLPSDKIQPNVSYWETKCK